MSDTLGVTGKTLDEIASTAEQQIAVQQATGKNLAVVELKAESLEARVAPGVRFN